MAHVDGEIKFEGEPIEKGNILFAPSDGTGPTAGGEITNGQFSISVPPGLKRIEVRSPKVVGQRKVSEGPVSPSEVMEERIPSTYNRKSTLTKEIQMPQTRIDLDLKP